MKVYVISLSGDGKRVKLRAYAKREDAVTEMERLTESFNRRLHHTNVGLEEIDGLLVIAFYDEGGTSRYERAVMTELNVTEGSTEKAVTGESKLVNNDWEDLELEF